MSFPNGSPPVPKRDPVGTREGLGRNAPLSGVGSIRNPVLFVERDNDTGFPLTTCGNDNPLAMPHAPRGGLILSIYL